MPNIFQESFIYDNKIVKYRFYEGLYQARYRKNGYNIEVASKDFDSMKCKFMKCIINKPQPEVHQAVNKNSNTGKDPLFADYALEWLEIKEKTTKASTFKEYKRSFDTNLKPKFGNMKLSEISRNSIQDYLFEFVNSGKFRTAEKLKLELNCIFDMAVDDFQILSPMSKIILPFYESKKGIAFSKEEEQKLIDYCIKRNNDVSSALLVLIYFGLRQSELPSLKIIDGKFLECETSKERMGRNIVLRRIPFTPVLKRVLKYIDFEKAKNVNIFKLRSAFKRLFPAHHPHELRYTFITRCKECGVNHEVVMLWDGHSFESDVKTTAVDRGYTDYSEDYILQEAEKVNYIL